MLTMKKQPPKQEKPQSQVKPPIPERRAENETAPEDKIRLLAYRKWQEAQSPVSDGIEFWLAAETEILRGKPR